MKLKLYQARLRTGNKTIDDIKARFEGEYVTEQELNKWLDDYKLIDGTEVVVAKGPINDNDYSLMAWDPADDEKWRDYIYANEQDPYFGTYIDAWDEFLEDWNNGDYSPAGSMVFHENDVEIIQELKKGGERNDR